MRRYALSILVLLFGSLLILLAVSARAAQVTVAWDPGPPEEEVTGCIVYHGPAPRGTGGYPEEIDVGNVTQATVEVPAGALRCFAVVAYNAYGLRSDYSNEVCTVVDVSDPRPAVVRVRRVWWQVLAGWIRGWFDGVTQVEEVR